MKVTYLRPCRAVDAPALAELVPETLPASCYLVEVSAEAGIEGPLIEGDVLVVDEARPVQHADLVVVDEACELRLFRSHRIGGGFYLVPAGGGQGMAVSADHCCGVVVRHGRVA
jgi:SOS-response transcriptional repressor LexA